MLCYHATGGCRKPIESGSGVVVESVYRMHVPCADAACKAWGVEREDLRHVAWAMESVYRFQRIKGLPEQVDLDRIYKALELIDCPFSRPLFPPFMEKEPPVPVDNVLPLGDRNL